RPDQVWVSDITYITMGKDFIYLAVVMDVFTRRILGWHLWPGLDASLALGALHMALRQGTPEIHHSDQGVQYACALYTDSLRENQITISMADTGAAWQNGHAERLMRTIKDEEVHLA